MRTKPDNFGRHRARLAATFAVQPRRRSSIRVQPHRRSSQASRTSGSRDEEHSGPSEPRSWRRGTPPRRAVCDVGCPRARGEITSAETSRDSGVHCAANRAEHAWLLGQGDSEDPLVCVCVCVCCDQWARARLNHVPIGTAGCGLCPSDPCEVHDSIQHRAHCDSPSSVGLGPAASTSAPATTAQLCLLSMEARMFRPPGLYWRLRCRSLRLHQRLIGRCHKCCERTPIGRGFVAVVGGDPPAARAAATSHPARVGTGAASADRSSASAVGCGR